MKQIVVLIMVITTSLAVSQSEGFSEQMMNDLMSMGMSAFQDMPFKDVGTMLDNTTTSGFEGEIDMLLGMIKADFCFAKDEKCESSLIMGCNCQNTFRKLEGACHAFPCNMMTLVYEKAAGAIEMLQYVDNYETFMNVVMNHMASPLLELMCECNDHGLFKAITTCFKNYEFPMYVRESETESVSEMETEYRTVVNAIDFEAIDRLLTVIVGSMCLDDPNKEGSKCHSAMSQSITDFGRWMDNTFSRSFKGNKCHTLKRLRGPLKKLFKTFFSKDWSSMKPSSLTSTVKKIIRQQVALSRSFYCSENCYAAVIDTFQDGACCGYASHDYLITHNVSEALLDVAKNMFMLSYNGDMKFPRITEGFLTNQMEQTDPTKCNEEKVANAYQALKDECPAGDL